ncbi:MAG: aminotransferase class I/II-fold pyridoxal phosphate-dependent enzyme [Chloroflexi bacterium]|nr:aminotransferase class I/II-fold pyridoxal phosphate-dependent enzyme [Chloroflexota bacterium]
MANERDKHEPSLAVQRIASISRRPAVRPGPDVISLSSGDPNFETPAYIRQALIDAITEGYTHYTDNQGDPQLRAALAAQLSAGGQSWTPAEVVVTHGGSGAVAASVISTINPGDRVLLPEPTYSLYADLVRFVDAEPIFVQQTADFHLDLDALAAVAPGASMIMLCHPNNPTGVVYSRSELEALAALAEAHDLLVLADEAYDHIVYPGVAFVSTLTIPALRPRLLYCQTFSKTYAMTGWRIGYLAAPEPIVKAAARIHRTFNGTMNAAVQRAALAAVTTPSDGPALRCAEFDRRRQLALDILAGVEGISVNAPDGAFYLFVKSLDGLSSHEMLMAADEFGVAIRAGNEYGPSGEGFVRIAFSSSVQEVQEGVTRLGHMFRTMGGSRHRQTL